MKKKNWINKHLFKSFTHYYTLTYINEHTNTHHTYECIIKTILIVKRLFALTTNIMWAIIN